MNFLYRLFGGKSGGKPGGVQWETLVHNGPIFIDYIGQQKFEVYLKDKLIPANNE